MPSENYVDILIKSLEKKISIMQELLDFNKQQTALLDAKPFDPDAFTSVMDEKEKRITTLVFLDNGFSAVYDRTKEELDKNRALYAQQIKQMQELIKEITRLSTAIETGERRNDAKLKSRFTAERARVRQSKTTVKAATGYYKNMSGMGIMDSRYMDTKF